MEVWKEIKDYEGLYLVSSYGRIKSIKSDRILRPTIQVSKGLQLNLCKNGVSKTFQIGRVVATAFIPNPENKPEVDHIDGIRHHNFVENLRWCTHAENMSYELAIENKTKYPHKIQGFGSDGMIVVEFENYKDAAKKGFARAMIKKSIETGKEYKGLIYKYKIITPE